MDLIVTYADDGWWFNRFGEHPHDPQTPFRYPSSGEAAEIGAALAARVGREHRVHHA